MFDKIKEDINFSIIKKAIADKTGNINIKNKKYYNTLMITYLQGKNELVYNATGMNLINIDDIEDAYNWPEEFCKRFFTVSYDGGYDALLCPWCHMYNMSLEFNIECDYKDLDSCTYGKRHGYCSSKCGSCGMSDISGYLKVTRRMAEINKKSSFVPNIHTIPGVMDLYNAYRNLVQLRIGRFHS